MWLKDIADSLINKHKTNCPFDIASNLKICITPWDLHEEINGYYKYHRRNKYIVINNNLSEDMQRVVCAHELGHALLHPRANTPFMRKSTFFSIDKLEQEANRFAVQLLILDHEIIEYSKQFTIFDIAAKYGVPIELIKYKFSTIL
ncbi:ImmA/IrrE family metallo-endopeptidase [Lysinibacillus agricola]|uniref:ImmA/IrrE family metallo-endopeptidase n=1 Tax=Lysinibacillus agricola TaxID=2590012 RepID=A0ABX7AL20_9BACI|nr:MULTISPECIES: ImmA/IrrE family metallo-endopeptidase [Lysinibacillus]KOS64663.1 hypothetical protein AN161_01185 [Lysinibacillus sp. FJAT-14222]QQP10464.1 ImmA/IrrE family metallo-endopeptidase [Lysinibacillus agricola]